MTRSSAPFVDELHIASICWTDSASTPLSPARIWSQERFGRRCRNTASL